MPFLADMKTKNGTIIVFSATESKKMQKNEGKSAFFCKKIWSYQKKAVPLHSLLKKEQI